MMLNIFFNRVFMQIQKQHPIGIFDSGVGGLTIAHALKLKLPHENMIYFGDTAHMPYGEKSASAIQAYTIRAIHFLLREKCKLIVIACNTASAAAYDLVKEYVAGRAEVVNVIDPVIQHLKLHYSGKKIGLIGTRHTVQSNVFKKKIDAIERSISLFSHATNLLASAIEEFGNHPVLDALLSVYLDHEDFKQIDALILGCTHYPIIQNRIAEIFKNQLPMIDIPPLVAEKVFDYLNKNQLFNSEKEGKRSFYVSDYTASFEKNAKLFFGEDIQLQAYPIWDEV